jgi:alpha-1,6-mannosyltransferase
MSHERMDENAAAYMSAGRTAQRFCRWYMKWVYFPQFDHHVTVSEHTAEELIRASRGHKVRRGIWVAPMGVDCDRFTPARRSDSVREHLLQMAGGTANSTVVLYAGRLAPEKNLSLLIEAAALLDPAKYRILIFGGGILLDDLKRECASRGLRHVVFGGHVADRDLLADYFANADVFAHPNPREPFGITPLEAMASGLALVAPDAGGVTSYAHQANAWLTRPSAEAFARAIEAVRANPAARSLKVEAARTTAEAHRWTNVAARYLRLYRELHALTQGEHSTETIAARSYSTPGDAFGRELIEL